MILFDFALREFKLDILGGFKTIDEGSNMNTHPFHSCYNPKKIIKASDHSKCVRSLYFQRFPYILFFLIVSIKQFSFHKW